MTATGKISAKLKGLRESTGLSIRAIAAELGMSANGYAHYENPDRFKDPVLPLPMAERFAEVLGRHGADPAAVMALTGMIERPVARLRGMEDQATAFTMPQHRVAADAPDPTMSALFGAGARSPATYRLRVALPAFQLLVDDILVADLSRLPRAGELALVTAFNETTAASETSIRRYLPPFLPGGDPSEQSILRADDPGVSVRYAIVGALRGIKTGNNG